MERVWFLRKGRDSPKCVVTLPDGTIPLRNLADNLQLDITSMELGGAIIPADSAGINSAATWTELKNVLNVSGTEEVPVIVDGRGKVEALAGRQQEEKQMREKEKQLRDKEILLLFGSNSTIQRARRQQEEQQEEKQMPEKEKQLRDKEILLLFGRQQEEKQRRERQMLLLNAALSEGGARHFGVMGNFGKRFREMEEILQDRMKRHKTAFTSVVVGGLSQDVLWENEGSLNLQPEHDPMGRTEMKRPRGAHGGVVGKSDNGEYSWRLMVCHRNAIDISQWVAGSTQNIDVISKIMDEFGGGIPAEYYAREEEIMVFKCFLKEWKESGSEREKPKLAIVGSPGVGKTTFIVLLAFFLVTCRNQRVLLLKKLKKNLSYALILLENGRYCGESVVNLDYVGREYLNPMSPDTWYFIDGFTGDDVRQNHGALGAYSLLATSSQFVPKGDDPTQRILLPAWQFSDLAGLCKKTEMHTEEINRRYYISGGSLRDFRRPEAKQRDIADSALRRVGSSSDAMQLLLNYGGATSGQIDTIRRAFLDDRTEVNQYMLCRHWKLFVDSGFILRSLLSRCSLEEYEQMYNVTRVIGGALFGSAFEYLLHKKASSGGFCIKVQEYIDGKLCPNESWFIEIPDGVALGEGTNKEECMASLKRFALGRSSNYWYPDFAQFPTIDCVARGLRYSSDDKDLGEVVVYIQVTVVTPLM